MLTPPARLTSPNTNAPISPPKMVTKKSSGNNIILRLHQEYGYIINVTQGDTEIMDYQLGDGDNVINIYQNQ